MRKRQARPSTLLGTQLTVRMEFQTLNTFSSMTESESAQRIIRELRDEMQIATFGARLKDWLGKDQTPAGEQKTIFPESRARALLRATNLIDDAALKDFANLVAGEAASRVALYDLLSQNQTVRSLIEYKTLHVLNSFRNKKKNMHNH